MRAIYLHWLTPNDIFWTTGFLWLSEFDQFMPKRTGFYSRCYFWQKCKKNYKISCSGNGSPPQRWRKTWKWCQFLLIFECHDCSVSFRSFGLFASRSRGVTWTTSDLISRDWRRIQFWKCSILAFWENSLKTKLKNYKTELNSLRRGLIRSRTLKTPSIDLSRPVPKNLKIPKIRKLGKINSMRLPNSSLFFMVKYTRE